jgi:hypothetical protein
MEITFYYDSYEAHFGDGFYPQLEKGNSLDSSMQIKFSVFTDSKFYKKEMYWKQEDQMNIWGLDGDCGDKLLKKLNESLDIYEDDQPIIVKNRDGDVIHPKPTKQ